MFGVGLLGSGVAGLGGETFLAGEGSVEVGLEVVASLDEGTQARTVEEPDPVDRDADEFGTAGVGRLVDPVDGQAAGEHVDGGVLAVEGDERVVGMAAAGHGDVQVADVGGSVEDDEGVVDGAALGGGAGGGVAQLDVLGDVAGGEGHGAGGTGDGEAVVGVDGGDGPPGPVADHVALGR